MLKPVLVVLTLAPGGGTHLALSSPEDAQDCAARAAAVREVLQDAGTQVIAARCAETELRFTPYAHGETRPPPVHPWRVTLPETGAILEPLDAAEDCTPAPDASPAVHCALSAQGVTD